jgi:hypothetical protein
MNFYAAQVRRLRLIFVILSKRRHAENQCQNYG